MNQTSPSPGARAVEAFQIEDVFVVASECWVVRDLNQLAPLAEFVFAYTFNVQPEVVVQERKPSTGAESWFTLRYFVKAQVRVLKAAVQASSPDAFADANLLADLKFTIATDYRGPKELVQDQAVVGAFSRNAHFHAWPYIREEVHAMCGRLRIPNITLPMLKPNQLGVTSGVQSVQTSGADRPTRAAEQAATAST